MLDTIDATIDRAYAEARYDSDYGAMELLGRVAETSASLRVPSTPGVPLAEWLVSDEVVKAAAQSLADEFYEPGASPAPSDHRAAHAVLAAVAALLPAGVEAS